MRLTVVAWSQREIVRWSAPAFGDWGKRIRDWGLRFEVWGLGIGISVVARRLSPFFGKA